MAGDGTGSFSEVLEDFQNAVKSVSDNGNLNEKAKILLKKFHWEKPEGLAASETEEELVPQNDEEIIEFYNKHVHVTDSEFHVAALHVNFILECLEKTLSDHNIPALKICRFVPYGAASEGMSLRLIPYFDVLLPVEVAVDGTDVFDITTPSQDSLIPAGFVKLSVADDSETTIPKKFGNEERGKVIVNIDESGTFLSPVGFREHILGPLIEEAVTKCQQSIASSMKSTFRVFLQKTKKSLDIVIEPNKSWLSAPMRQTSFTLSFVPSVFITQGTFPIYAVAKPRYWKNISSTDVHNPLWQLVLPSHEHHLLNTLIPKDNPFKQAMRILKTLQIMRMKRNPDSTLMYLNSYYYKMALLSHLHNGHEKSHPASTLQECLAEFIMIMLSKIKACTIHSIFFANDEVFQYFAKCDSSILKNTGPVNVADTLTAAIAGDIRKELQTTLRSYDWGSEVWTIALDKEAEVARNLQENKPVTLNQENPMDALKIKSDGDLKKNLADDSWFLRIVGMSLVIALVAVAVYSIFGEF